jgi:hypothetical protein
MISFYFIFSFYFIYLFYYLFIYFYFIYLFYYLFIFIFILFYFILFLYFILFIFTLFYFILFYLYMSRCSAVDTATRLRGFVSRLRQIFFSSPKRPGPRWGPPSFLFNCDRGSFPGIRRKVDHSPQSNDEVRKEWSYTSTPLYCFMCWTRETLPFKSTAVSSSRYMSNDKQKVNY